MNASRQYGTALYRVIAALWHRLTPADVADGVVREAAAVLGAPAAMVALFDDAADRVRVMASIGYAESVSERWTGRSMRDFPVVGVERSGQATVERRDRLYPSILKHLDGRDHGAEEVPITRAIRGETISGEELFLTCFDGAQRLVRVSAVPVRNDAGEIEASVAAFSDITEERAVAEQLRKNERRHAIHGQLQLQREEVDLSAVVTEAAERLEEQFQRGSTPLVIDASAHVTGQWDRLRLDLVTNLLTNALRYGDRRPVNVHVDADGAIARVTVSDRGIGIRPQDQARIFERFVRAAPARQFGGLGVGLWLARQIAEAHGGTLDVVSAPHVGSSFTLALPQAR